MFYRKPSYETVFKHVLKNLKKTDSFKKSGSTFKTTTPFSKTIQKVYFDTKNEIIKLTSLYEGREEIDMKLKPTWLGDGQVSFKVIY